MASDAPSPATWVAEEICRLRALSFEDLAALEGQPQHRAAKTDDGQEIVLETQIVWDDRERVNVRILVDVWDPAKRAGRSLPRDDFIRAPDGSFVDK